MLKTIVEVSVTRLIDVSAESLDEALIMAQRSQDPGTLKGVSATLVDVRQEEAPPES